MQISLHNKTALVVAASQGLGKAIAHQLVQSGANVYICARHESELHITSQAIGATGIVCDLTQPQDITDLLAIIGPIDILVTNAGGPPPGSVENITDEQWQAAYDLTFMSAVRLIRGCLPMMQKNKWGRIICLTSTSVKQPIDNLIISNSLRSAVTNLVKTISNEVAQDNITVNAVAPGMFNTQRMQELIKNRSTLNHTTVKETKTDMIKDIPLHRFGNVEELAAAVTFLASEQASYITGIELPVDGGLTHSI